MPRAHCNGCYEQQPLNMSPGRTDHVVLTPAEHLGGIPAAVGVLAVEQTGQSRDVDRRCHVRGRRGCSMSDPSKAKAPPAMRQAGLSASVSPYWEERA